MHLSPTSKLGYLSFNLQTAVVAILIFEECQKQKASDVLVVLRPYQNMKSIRYRFLRYCVQKQLWTDIWTNRAIP